MIKVSSPALLAYLTFPVPERIGGTYDAIIVNGKYDWYIMPLQDRQNGTGNLSPDQMHMCQVRTFLLYQLFQLPGCFPVIEIIDDVFYRLQQFTSGFLLFRKIRFIFRRIILRPSQCKIDNLFAMHPQQLHRTEIHDLRTTLTIVKDVNLQNFH